MRIRFSKVALTVGISLALVFTFSCSSDEDVPNGGGDNGSVSSSSSKKASSSSNAIEQKDYCVYSEIQQCYFGPYSVCPGVGGTLSNSCPYGSSSSVAGSSSSQGGGSSSSQGDKSSSSSAGREYDYCVFISDRMCLMGPMSDCPPGGTLSNSCPYSSSSSVEVSSSSVVSSSSSPSSSSVASSSSSRPSSSSVASSSSISIIYGTPVTYNGETYETVVIGTQTWFKRNLNYNVSGSKCYNNIEANCTKYGRLYDWATAMGFDATCNSSTCASLVQTKHKGICPQGWHIPSDADWSTLMKFVNPDCSNNINCDGAGTKLKATSGWNSYEYVPVGTDNYGFSALPGGLGYSDGSFFDVGNYGSWWSASEYDSDSAYRRIMRYNDDHARWLSIDKTYLYSVRCLQD